MSTEIEERERFSTLATRAVQEISEMTTQVRQLINAANTNTTEELTTQRDEVIRERDEARHALRSARRQRDEARHDLMQLRDDYERLRNQGNGQSASTTAVESSTRRQPVLDERDTRFLRTFVRSVRAAHNNPASQTMQCVFDVGIAMRACDMIERLMQRDNSDYQEVHRGEFVMPSWLSHHLHAPWENIPSPEPQTENVEVRQTNCAEEQNDCEEPL